MTEYNIKVPSMYVKNIAEEVEVAFTSTLEPYEKKKLIALNMQKTIRNLFVTFSVFSSLSALSQDDLLSLVDDKKTKALKRYATLKTVRIGNAQTIETVKKHHLDYRISHRFATFTILTLRTL